MNVQCEIKFINHRTITLVSKPIPIIIITVMTIYSSNEHFSKIGRQVWLYVRGIKCIVFTRVSMVGHTQHTAIKTIKMGQHVARDFIKIYH